MKRAICALVVLSAIPSAWATAIVNLGTADSFAVLAGSTVTNTGNSTINGDLGVWPGTAVTGFPPGTLTGGVMHDGDAVALQAQTDLTTAYNSAAGRSCDSNRTGQDLGGKTLLSGVYCFDTSAQLTGTLTLDAQGDPNAVFIFQIGSTLTTASASSVLFTNGGEGDSVFWQVGSSATLGTTTAFQGNILALASITLNTGATIGCGRALARNGAVTLDTNNVSSDTEGCETTVGVGAVPEPGSAFLFASGGLLFGLFVLGSRIRVGRRQA
ncbi:MAG: ice-binding family protein [Terriglobia bacterium]